MSSVNEGMDVLKLKEEIDTTILELIRLKERFCTDELRTLFNEMIVTLTNYCLNDCVNRNCRECRINKVINVISAKLDELDKIKELERNYRRLFNVFVESVFKEKRARC